MAGSNTFCFPLLKTVDIVHCIREYQVPVDETDLKDPNSQTVRRIYEVLLELIMNDSKEDMSQPAFSGLHILNYPELHDESIPELAYLRAVNKMMMISGVHDFTVRDIIQPEAKRLRRHLSAVINFGKYRQERFNHVNQFTKQTEILLENKKELEQQQERLKQELKELESQRSSEEPAIQKLTQECTDLKAEVNTLNTEHAKLRNEGAEIKAKNKQLMDIIASKDYTIRELKLDNEKTSSQVVTSPARVKREIAAGFEVLENLRKELTEMEKKNRDLQAYSDSFLRLDKDIHKTINLMEEVQADMLKCKEAKRVVKAKVREMNEYQEQEKENNSQIERMIRLYKQRVEAQNATREQTSMKIEAAEQAMKAAASELEQAKSEKHNSYEHMVRSKAAAEKLIEQRSELVRTHSEAVRKLGKGKQALLETVENYNQRIATTLQQQYPEFVE